MQMRSAIRENVSGWHDEAVRVMCACTHVDEEMKARKKVFGRVRIRSRADARVNSKQHRRKRREDPEITKDITIERFGDEALQ